MQAISALTRSANLIFAGTVIERGASSVPILPDNENLVVVRVDRGLRVDPVLGDLKDKLITVAARVPETLSVGLRAIFFTNRWIFGRGIAVRELDHVDVGEEERVATVVAELPELHLLTRLRNAELVVEAVVLSVGPVEKKIHDRDAALWAPAYLEVVRILRGNPRHPTVVYFPTSERPDWILAPRFHIHQRGIFILHPRPLSDDVEDDGPTVPATGLVALDPSDFQPASQLAYVEKLLLILESGGRHP